ncbi:O-antigen ligase [Cellulophaga sp. L1A9]|uniref:O-antigen ligase family protein n=1 Tax=Cellulophaga sp. L1A9 TaxID=2686362 RepID=UPI00131BBC5B|nr:O-antigen ligase family protein [Cellulophaga sp. L1A9]
MNKSFIGSLVLAMLTAIIFNAILSSYIERKIKSDLISIEFEIESNVTFNSELYYAYKDGFKSENKIKNSSKSKDSLKFILTKNEKYITNYRLDLGNDNHPNTIQLKSILFLFNDGYIKIKDKEVYTEFFLNSEAINLTYASNIITINEGAEVFDPYIIFNPLSQTIIDHNPIKKIILLLPFIIFGIIVWKKIIPKNTILSVEDYLMIIFIICIPLKIAWTTLATLLLVAYSLYKYIRNRKLGENALVGYFLIILFLLFAIIGRPNEIQKIDHQLGIALFGIIALTLEWNSALIKDLYIKIFIILNAILITASIIFLLNFPLNFGLELTDYFIHIKTFSGNIRNFLYFDHAAFLTFFGLIGLLFLKHTKNTSKKEKILNYSYHIFLLLTIILMGVRICLIIYIILLLNILLKNKIKKPIIVNFGIFIFLALTLFLSIKKIDKTRAALWQISWEAIKEKPFLGHGIGSSDRVLHSTHLMKEHKVIIPEALNHSHNQYLTLLIEIGFIGCLTLATFILAFLFRIKLYKNITMVLFIFALSLMFLTESILQTSKPLYILCFLFLLISTNTQKPVINEN